MDKKSRIIIASLIVVSLFLSVFIYMRVSKQLSTKTQKEAKVTFEQIIKDLPDESSLSKLIGEPKDIGSKDDTKIYYFDSSNPNKNNEVVYKNDKLILTREIVAPKDNKNSSEITIKYGATNNVLYGPDAAAGFYLFVYPDKGIAFVGNPNSGDMLEKWYFEPTTIEEFKKLFATEYSDEKPIIYDDF